MNNMKRFPFKPIAGISVLILTVLVFVYYFVHHPEVGDRLELTSVQLFISLLALYLGGVVALAMVTVTTVRLCKIRLSGSDSLLLTMYSAIINFFGPLQSGPAFRAVYLKKKHSLNLKDYAMASVVYYFFYGGLSLLLLLSGILRWWLLPLALTGLGTGYLLSRSNYLGSRLSKLDLRGWYFLFLATGLQIAVVTAIYYLELRSVAPGIHLSQALTYSGAANLSLFVSLTPGAIGFRESFLVLSGQLHHISNSTIVAASILDRAMYLVLLALLAIFVFGTHAHRRLKAFPQNND